MRNISLSELTYRYKKLNNLTVSDLCGILNINVPKNLNHNKGWIGQLIEVALGIGTSSAQGPDIPEIGVEIKTIPFDFVKDNIRVTESTYVCKASFKTNSESLCWETSQVKSKLSKILWIPVLQRGPISSFKIISPFISQLTISQESQLKQDWLELTEMLYTGQVEQLSAKYGKFLQIRPKAANSKVKDKIINEQGDVIYYVPRGFYLRSKFTKEVLIKNIL